MWHSSAASSDGRGRCAGSARLRSTSWYVAAGRFEAFWEQHLKPWDVAAGALIVEEAGGLVTGMDGAPFDAAAAHLDRVERSCAPGSGRYD